MILFQKESLSLYIKRNIFLIKEVKRDRPDMQYGSINLISENPDALSTYIILPDVKRV